MTSKNDEEIFKEWIERYNGMAGHLETQLRVAFLAGLEVGRKESEDKINSIMSDPVKLDKGLSYVIDKQCELIKELKKDLKWSLKYSCGDWTETNSSRDKSKQVQLTHFKDHK